MAKRSEAVIELTKERLDQYASDLQGLAAGGGYSATMRIETLLALLSAARKLAEVREWAESTLADSGHHERMFAAAGHVLAMTNDYFPSQFAQDVAAIYDRRSQEPSP